jgi:hypothetical protein
MAMMRKTFPWLAWFGISLALVAYLTQPLLDDGADKGLFVPGEMSHGHYQIEMACTACHTESFGGKAVLQDACMNCHGEELKQAKDAHPKSKFTNPRNADRVKQLDARYCMACHVEHQPGQTGAMAVTLPEDFCFKCHADIGEERPSHRELAFTSCATGGCHNFHDNRALYEDFLAKHLHEPDVLPEASVSTRNLAEYMRLVSEYPTTPLQNQDKDAPLSLKVDARISDDWLSTAHAGAGVNCTDCHAVGDARAGKTPVIAKTWTDKPDHKVCMNCHQAEGEGFQLGKHGMRLTHDLSPLVPGMVRQPMRKEAADKEVSCVSCHTAHRFDTRPAAVESCLNCHNDQHSLAYKESPHFSLWHKEVTGQSRPGSGVSCATCHLPRQVHQQDGFARVIVQHNQNDNLRPNEKMVRSVCMNCHGLGFSIDALADTELVKRNFDRSPGKHIESLDWAEKRLQAHEAR